MGSRHTDEVTAEMLSAASGVYYTFHHDPGELSAASYGSDRTLVNSRSRPLYRRWLGALVCSLERLVRELTWM